jgi:hypothetical protein
MKMFVSVLLVFLLASCGTVRIGESDIEYCSRQGSGFFPSGVVSESSTTKGSSSMLVSGNATHYNNRGSSVNSYGNASGVGSSKSETESRSLACHPTDVPYNKCLSQKLKKSGIEIVEFNSKAKTKETIAGVGYVLWIVPGIIAAIVNTSTTSSKKEEINKVRDEAYQYCAKYKTETDL